jgi:hypothetical protein
MIKQQIIAGSGFSLPDVEDKLSCWLSSALGTRLGQTPHPLPFSSTNSSIYWSASYYGLDKVRVFLDATPSEQVNILQLCSRGILEEIYSIEKAGVSYMAKMVLLCETIEEQMLYGLFSADEVTHLAQIGHFLPTQTAQFEHQFLQFLMDIVDTQEKAVILFVLQVVLEGWSLSHYRSLAINCREPDLSLALQSFLVDESRHHSTGVMLFHQTFVSQASQKMIVETLVEFLKMLQIGQQRVVTAIEMVKGHLSRSQKIRVFEELDTETHRDTRLKFLRSLMRNPNSGAIVQQLEARGAFQALSVSQYV